jgi:hypothetical protein
MSAVGEERPVRRRDDGGNIDHAPTAVAGAVCMMTM